jgi:signal transduction histidine kinase
VKRGDTRLPLTVPQFLRAAAFVSSGMLVIAVFLFTNGVVGRLSREVTTTSRVLAQFCAEASFPAVRDAELQRILGEVIASIDFPLVITDVQGVPRAWRGIGVEAHLVPAQSIDSLAAGLPIAPVIRARIETVRARAERMDRRNRPIFMTQRVPPDTLGAVHYDDPPVLERLRWMPYVSVGGVVIMIWLGVWGLASIRQAERRSIWVGLAKETAHQLGTPLSSLMGWIELLRARTESGGGVGDVRLARADLDETLSEMEHDVERLSKVAQRFSHVGSAPNLQPQALSSVVREAVLYMRRRLPAGGADIEVRERYEDVPPVNLNRELVEWALENILNNAVSALDKRPGLIEVVVERRKETEAVEVMIRDNGRGMTPAEQRRAFEPGYTTKRRGWGLGLALARRVVQEYHGGKVQIAESIPGRGTTVLLTFPT